MPDVEVGVEEVKVESAGLRLTKEFMLLVVS
jgi:hypothetical protein